MTAFALALALVLVVGAVYGVASLVRLGRAAREVRPFLSGHDPAEHAVSRFHVRWYAVTMIFLAFDMEMVFMYPWAVVFFEIGWKAFAEMGMFITILVLGILYAWRERAFEWE